MVNHETCSVDGCEKPTFRNGHCSMHWQRLRRRGTLDEPPSRGRDGEFMKMVRDAKPAAAIPICGHPARKHNARGMCGSCYARFWAKENPEAMCGGNWAKANRAASYESQRSWAKANPALKKKYQRSTNLRRYGLNTAGYEAIWESQSGKCANKGCTFSADKSLPNFTKGLVVDHDHKTGRVRGLICHPCNSALGHAKDDIDRLRGLIEYLGGD